MKNKKFGSYLSREEEIANNSSATEAWLLQYPSTNDHITFYDLENENSTHKIPEKGYDERMKQFFDDISSK
jgi:hypothetical protein